MPDRVSKPWKETESVNINHRLRRKEKISSVSKLKFIGNNADGLMNKQESLENILQENPSAVFLQEIQSLRPGRIKTPSSGKYSWYELHISPNAEKGERGVVLH